MTAHETALLEFSVNDMTAQNTSVPENGCSHCVVLIRAYQPGLTAHDCAVRHQA